MKKVLTYLFSMVLVAALAVAGTVAYLQDTDSDVNTMTVGNVYIDHFEYERDSNGDLNYFTNNQQILPAVITGNVGRESKDFDFFRPNGSDNHTVNLYTNVNNVIDKFVTVYNSGKSSAYIRTFIAIETPNGIPSNYINVNFNDNAGISTSDWFTIQIGGVNYIVKAFTYNEALEPGKVSAPSLLQVYLDPHATNNEVASFGNEFKICVLSQAVQSAGFENATTALNTAFDEVTLDNVANWFGGVVVTPEYQ